MAVSKDRKKELNRAAYLRKKEEKELAEKKSAPVGSEEMKRDREWALSLDAEGQRAPGEFYTYEKLYEIFYGSHLIVPAKFIIEDEQLTFTRWLEYRLRCRQDLWFLGERLGHRGLKKSKAHQAILDFFVKKTQDLPVDYTEEDLKKWLYKQDIQHNLMLLYPRGFGKSTWMMIDAVQWVLNCPDIVILSASATKLLSHKFLGLFRGYFSIVNPDEPTVGTPSGEFHILFPEFCIRRGKGRETGFKCPMARLGLKDPTLSGTSMEANTAGGRAHLIIFDDAQGDKNYQTLASRLKVRETYGAIRELAIQPYAFIEVGGTRWTEGVIGDEVIKGRPTAVPDLYGTILQRIQRTDDKSWRVLCEPAWRPKPNAEDKPLDELLEEDVDLLWPNDPNRNPLEEPPSPGSFEVLKKKLNDDEILFRCNQLQDPAGSLEDDAPYLNQYTPENIRKEMRSSSFLDTFSGPVYLFGDTAMTSNKKSDYSAFAIAKIELREKLDPMIWWAEIRAGHWTDKQTAVVIAELMEKWRPNESHIEEIPSTTNWFKDEVRRQIVMRQCQHLYLHWFRPDDSRGAKEGRIRGLQLLHERGLMKYVTGSWIDLMVKQLTEYNGDKKLHRSSKGGRKDDIPDAMSFVLLPGILPYIDGVSKPEDEAVLKIRSEQIAMRVQYNRIFGTDPGPSGVYTAHSYPNSLPPQPTAADLEDDKAHNPIHDALAPLFGNRMPRQAFPRKSEGN